jgi:predicted N-formylglutamate amidohydrolase
MPSRKSRISSVTSGAPASGRLLVVVTCEHGGNDIPKRWAPLFRDRRAELRTHRGYDIGAARVAEIVAGALHAPLFVAHVSRLLVDLNRSPNNPRRFSEVIRALPAAERERIVREYYEPHRGAVEGAVARAIGEGRRVLHVGVHSFTPVLHGVVRRADVGLLYDPRRKRERELCSAWQGAMTRAAPSLVVRRNYPYRGVSDGFTTALRRAHGGARYEGVEVELNQARLGSNRVIDDAGRLLAESLVEALERRG